VAHTSAYRRALWGTTRSEVQRALPPLQPLRPQDVRGDHRGGDLLVPQELLDRAHVIPCHPHMRGETVAARVRRRALHPPGLPDDTGYGPLDRLLVEVMAVDGAGARVVRAPGCRKHILPTPLPIGMGVLACQRMRQGHPPRAGGEGILVQPPHTLQMVAHARMERFRTPRQALLCPLPVAPAHLGQTAIDILHAQTEPREQTHAAALQALRAPLVDAWGGQEDALDLVFGQHDGQGALRGGPHGSDAGVIQRDAERTARERNRKALQAGCGVERATWPAMARGVRNASIAAGPISCGWRLWWNRISRCLQLREARAVRIEECVSRRIARARSSNCCLGGGPCIPLPWTFSGSILVLHGLSAPSGGPSAGGLLVNKCTVVCRNIKRNIKRYWISRRLCRSISCSASCQRTRMALAGERMRQVLRCCVPFLLLSWCNVHAAPISVGAAPKGDATVVASRIIKYNFPSCKHVSNAVRLPDGSIQATCDGIVYRVFTVYSTKEGKMLELAMNCEAAKRLLNVSC
jgi:hypothetical protein